MLAPSLRPIPLSLHSFQLGARRAVCREVDRVPGCGRVRAVKSRIGGVLGDVPTPGALAAWPRWQQALGLVAHRHPRGFALSRKQLFLLVLDHVDDSESPSCVAATTTASSIRGASLQLAMAEAECLLPDVWCGRLLLVERGGKSCLLRRDGPTLAQASLYRQPVQRWCWRRFFAGVQDAFDAGPGRTRLRLPPTLRRFAGRGIRSRRRVLERVRLLAPCTAGRMVASARRLRRSVSGSSPPRPLGVRRRRAALLPAPRDVAGPRLPRRDGKTS